MKRAPLIACCVASVWPWLSSAEAGADSAVADDAGTLTEIVVTAQKRTQKLQDVPAAVSAISGADLQNRGIVQTDDLSGEIPNLQITSAFGHTEPNFALRGISVANDFTTATASPVGIYVDEVNQSFRGTQGQQLYDLDRVEVLRGPQGTLYGRNTTGGAITFFTKRPELDGTHGYLNVGYGNYDSTNVEGAIDLTPVPEKLGVRLAATLAESDGWQYNVFTKGPAATTDSVATRMSVRWLPTSGLEENLKLYYALDNPISSGPYAIGHLAGGTDLLGYSRFGPQAQLGGALLGENEINENSLGRSYTKSYGAASNLKYDVNEKTTITSITGFDWGRLNLSPTDCSGSPTSVCNNEFYATSTNYNQDLRVNFDTSRFHLVSGLYYGIDRVVSDNHPTFLTFLQGPLLAAGLPASYNNIPIATPNSLKVLPAFALNPSLTPSSPGFCAPVVVNPNGFFDGRTLFAALYDTAATDSAAAGPASAACAAAGAPPFSPIIADQHFTLRRPSRAIYFDGSYDIDDRLTVSVGARYTQDIVQFLNARTTLYGLAGTKIVASTIPYSYPYNPSLPTVNESTGTNKPTGRVNLSYKFAPDIMGYVNYSRGYRVGNYNGFAYQGVNQVYYVPPEQVNAYEAGLKTRLFDRRVTLNIASFYYDYKNQQFIQIVQAAPFARVANGDLFGGEAELTASILRNVRLNMALGLLHSEYTGNSTNPNNPASPSVSVSGNPFPNAPDRTFSGSVVWDIFNNGSDRLTLTGGTTYQGHYYYDPFKNYDQTPCGSPPPGSRELTVSAVIACGNPGYWLVNGRLTYFMGQHYSVSAWVKNLTDKYYYTYGIPIQAFDLDYMTRGVPRTFGVQLTGSF